VAQVITSTGGYYELEEVEFGRIYKWQPEIVTLECTCGKRSDLSMCVTNCEACGTDHATVIREWLGSARRPEEDEIHPWRYTRHGGENGLPF
jgi:hypothetical protein